MMLTMAKPAERWWQEVGARIKTTREERGMKAEDLGDILSHHANTIYGWESGKHPPYKELQSIAGVLGVDLPWLLHGDQAEEQVLERLEAQIGQITERMEKEEEWRAEARRLLDQITQRPDGR